MCEWGIPAAQVRLARPRRDGRETMPVDPCIAPLVQALNDAGIATVASCCGHGRQPGNVALADGREIIVASDYQTARRVHAAFPPIGAPRSRRKRHDPPAPPTNTPNMGSAGRRRHD